MSDVNQANIQTLYARFSQHLRQHGADDRAYALYRTQMRAALRSMPPQDALTMIVRLENALPQEENVLCAAMRVDEGIFNMHAGHLAHALNALKDACAISAKCRDKDGMVDGAFALAQCFHHMQDDASAKSSAQLCVRAIRIHYADKHPFFARACAYAEGDFSDLHQKTYQMESPASAKHDAPQDMPHTFIRPKTDAKIDPTLQQPSFVGAQTYDAPIEESVFDDTDALFEQDDFVDDGSLEQASFSPMQEEASAKPETISEPNLTEEAIETGEDGAQEVPAEGSAEKPVLQETPVMQLAPADGSLYFEDLQLVLGFSKKSEKITGASQRRHDVQTSILMGAQNGLLLQQSALDVAMHQQIDGFKQQGRFDEGLDFLGDLHEALPDDSAYQPQVSVWTAQMLADAGDAPRAVGLYSRIVEQMIQDGSAKSELGLQTMQQLCELYHQMEEFERELALRKVVLRIMQQNGAAEETVMDAGEDYMQTMLESGHLQDLDAMCRWYADKSGEPQLFAESVDALLIYHDAQENDEGVCDICRLAKDYCDKNTWPMQENWIAAWVLAAINLAKTDEVSNLAAQYETELASAALCDTVAILLQCADEFVASGAYDAAAEFYSICLNVQMTRGESEKEEETALKLADALEACGRKMEAEDIRMMYLPPPEPLTDADLVQKAAECEDKGDMEQAVAYRGELYRLRKENLGEEHPDTLAALNNYAKALSAVGNLSEAVLHQLAAVNGYANVMGQTHAYTLTAMNNLAKTMERAGQFTEAYAVRRKVYEIYCDLFPEGHTQVQLARKRMLRAKKLTTQI